MTISYHDNDLDEEPQTPLSDILRTNELLRYLDDNVFERFVDLIEKRSFRKGDIIENVDSFGFCIVGRGEVEARLDPNDAGDENPENERTIHKTRARGSLQPMSTFLEFLVESKMDSSSWGDTKSNLASSSGTQILSHLQFLASQDVDLYVVPRDILKDWLFKQHPQSTLHIIQEALRRYYSVVFPISGTYFGLNEQVATCLGTLVKLSSPFIQSDFLRKESTIFWIQKAQERIVKRIFSNGNMLNILDETAESTSPSTPLDGTIQHQHSQALDQEKTPLAERGSRQREASRRPVGLSLQTSSFGRKQEELLRPRTNGSATSLNELQTMRGNNKKGQRQVAKNPATFATSIKKELAKEILSGLGCERCLVEIPGSSTKNEELDTLNIASSAFKCSSRTNTNSFEELVQEYMGDIEVIHFAKDSVVVEEGHGYPGVFYVLDGSLAFKTGRGTVGGQKRETYLGTDMGPGSLVGSESILPNNKSLFKIVAKRDSFIGILPQAKIHELGNRFSGLFFSMSERLLTALPVLLRLADCAIDWHQFQPGQIVDKQIACQGLSIVLKGRLRIKQPIPLTNDFYTRDIGIGQNVGNPYLLDTEQSPYEMTCLRKSELVNIQLSAFETLALTEPRVALTLSRFIAANATTAANDKIRRNDIPEDHFTKPRTIALLALSSEVPVELFTARLVKAITATGIKEPRKMIELDSDKIIKLLGGGVFNNAGNVRLESYVASIEENFELTLLIGDVSPHSTWNRTCITHADSIILLGMADSSPSLSEMDKTLINVGTRSQLHLVLLHEDVRLSSGGLTSNWLEERPWVNGGHHHILMQTAILEKPPIEPSVLLQKSSDFHRLARRLFGRSIALVLGGGGARGVAHLGFMRAMEERGIPVDIVGGSSMGACIGGVFAKTLTVASTLERIKALSAQMRISTFLFDFTFPYVAKTTGAAFQREIRRLFGNANLDDMWLEYYCAVTNITKNCISQMQHKGEATTSIAASMSYCGLVPPTCMEGDMLVDACYSCNLPMRRSIELGAELVLVVDVSALKPLAPQSYGSTISGWRMLYRKLNSRYGRVGGEAEPELPPSLSDIHDRLNQGTSLRELEVIKNTPGCYYIPLPVNHYSSKDPSKLDELVEIGYQAGKAWFAEMDASQKLAGLAIVKN